MPIAGDVRGTVSNEDEGTACLLLQTILDPSAPTPSDALPSPRVSSRIDVSVRPGEEGPVLRVRWNGLVSDQMMTIALDSWDYDTTFVEPGWAYDGRVLWGFTERIPAGSGEREYRFDERLLWPLYRQRRIEVYWCNRIWSVLYADGLDEEVLWQRQFGRTDLEYGVL